jgi:hypothetical protein
MRVPKWITVKDPLGDVVDPVNVIFLLPIEEIRAVLQKDGWVRTAIENVAMLEGEKPLASYEKQIFTSLIRLHLRLWLIKVGELIVGNAHLDLPWITGHRSYHDVGRDYVANLFQMSGYSVELVFLDNATREHNGWAAKIYKAQDKVNI